MSAGSKIFASFVAASKVGAKGTYGWVLKNQTLSAGGMALLGTAAIINDASKRHLDTKTDAETKHKELHTYIDTKVKALEEQNLNIQHLILTCAVSTMKGFQGDTSEIEGFVKGVEMFEKKMECIRTGKCVQ